MKKKHIIITAIITAVCMFVATTAFYLSPIGRNIYYLVSGKGASKLALIEALIKSNYIGEIDSDKMNNYALSAYVAGLDDKYSVYLDKSSFNSLRENLEGDYDGIGVEVTVADDKIYVSEVISGSPAESAGILKGDYIIAVNSKEYSGKKLSEAIKEIKTGNENVVVTIERNSEKKDFTVKRKKVNMNYVTYKMIDNNIGYIRIKTYGDNISDKFREALEALKKDGMKKLIIDERSNPGGSLDSVVSMADMLLPKGIITTIKDKNGNKEEYKSDSSELGMPIVLIVNENSASASEVMAGALRDYKKAVIVGKKTYGKGVVQTVYDLYDGSALKVTIAKYYTPSGECIDQKGIKPDVEVELPQGVEINGYEDNIQNDTQLAKAIEIIKQK